MGRSAHPLVLSRALEMGLAVIDSRVGLMPARKVNHVPVVKTTRV